MGIVYRAEAPEEVAAEEEQASRTSPYMFRCVLTAKSNGGGSYGMGYTLDAALAVARSEFRATWGGKPVSKFLYRRDFGGGWVAINDDASDVRCEFPECAAQATRWLATRAPGSAWRSGFRCTAHALADFTTAVNAGRREVSVGTVRLDK